MQVHSLKERRKHEKALILEEVHKSVTQIGDLSRHPEIELLTELSPYALQLTHCIERVFVYGLKNSWKGSPTSFWEYILASVNILEDENLLREVALISSLSGLTNNARGRAFLRQSLHVERTAAYIRRITEDQVLAKSWYNDELSIFTSPKDRSKFLALLENISFKISFDMLLNDEKLNNRIFKLKEGFPVWINLVSLPRSIVTITPRKKKKRKNKKKKRKERLIDDMIQTDDRMNWEDSTIEKPVVFDISQDMLTNSYCSPPDNLKGILKPDDDEKDDIFSQLLSIQEKSDSNEPTPPLPSPPPAAENLTVDVPVYIGISDRLEHSKEEDSVIVIEPGGSTNLEPEDCVIDGEGEGDIEHKEPLVTISYKSSSPPTPIISLLPPGESNQVVEVVPDNELLRPSDDNSPLASDKEPSVVVMDREGSADEQSAGKEKFVNSERTGKSGFSPSGRREDNLEILSNETDFRVEGEKPNKLILTASEVGHLEKQHDLEGKEDVVGGEPSPEIKPAPEDNRGGESIHSGKNNGHPTAELLQLAIEVEEDASDSHISPIITIEDMLDRSPSPPSIDLKSPPKNDNWTLSPIQKPENKESKEADFCEDSNNALSGATPLVSNFNSEELYDDPENSLSSNNIPELPELPDWESPKLSETKHEVVISKPKSAESKNLNRILDNQVHSAGVQRAPRTMSCSALSPSKSLSPSNSLTLLQLPGQPGFSENHFRKPASSDSAVPLSDLSQSQFRNITVQTKPSVISQSFLGQGQGQRINLFKEAHRKPFSKGDMIELKTEQLPPRNNAALVERQKGLCDSCGASLEKNMFGRPLYHYCRYLGTLHCQNCIRNDRAIVPARVIHEIDCNMKKVCIKAKGYLDSMLNMPCISMPMFKDEVIQKSRELQNLKILIEQLKHIRQFIEVCRHKDAHYQQLNDQHMNYIMRSSMLTLQEVVDCIKGDFLKHLSSCANKLMKHIKAECTICKLRGHFCEICKDSTVIYSFDVQKVIQCEGCSNIFHRECWVKNDIESGVSCPKCLRETDRKCRRLVLKSAFRSDSFDST